MQAYTLDLVERSSVAIPLPPGLRVCIDIYNQIAVLAEDILVCLKITQEQFYTQGKLPRAINQVRKIRNYVLVEASKDVTSFKSRAKINREKYGQDAQVTVNTTMHNNGWLEYFQVCAANIMAELKIAAQLICTTLGCGVAAKQEKMDVESALGYFRVFSHEVLGEAEKAMRKFFVGGLPNDYLASTLAGTIELCFHYVACRTFALHR